MKYISIALLIASMCCGSMVKAQSQTAAKLQELGITLPNTPDPVGSYVPFKQVGNLVFINQVALVDGKILTPGVIGEEVSEKQAVEATRQAMLNVIAVLNQAVDGDLDRVKQAVQLTGIFNTSKGYTQHASLMNTASSLVVDIFSERGVHTRATLGASSLPINSPVEIQAIFEIKDTAKSKNCTVENENLSKKTFEDLYTKIDPKEIDFNIFKLLNEDWSVVTAGNSSDFNSMIASWGGFGIIFEKPVSWLFLNASRYTLEKVEKYNSFTLSYLDSRYKDQKLQFGTKSGRNSDKMEKSDLHSIQTPAGNMAYKEAYMIIELQLENVHELDPENFKTQSHKDTLIKGKKDGNGKEYHKMVTGIITNVWVRK